MDIKKTLETLKAQNVPDEEIAQFYRNYKQTGRLFADDNPNLVDNTTGVPASLRALMGNMSPGDQLKTLQKYYPDAQQQGDNFIYTNKDTGLPTLVNPKGFETGDVAQEARAGSQTVGGVIGGALGTPLSIATGNPIPTFLGMGLGDAIGGQAHDLYMQMLGREDNRNLMERANSAVVDVGMGALMPKVIDKGMQYAKPIAKGLMQPLKAFKKKAIKEAVTPESIEQFNALMRRKFKPEASMLLDTPETKAWSASMRRNPGSGNVVGATDSFNYQHGIDEIDKLASRYGTAKSKVSMGEDIRRGMTAAKKRSWEIADKLFEARDAVIPLNESIPVNNSLEFIKTFMDDIGGSKLATKERSSIIKLIDDFKSDLNKNTTMRMNRLRAAKEALGDVYKKTTPDGQDHLKKELYKAINKDIEAEAVRRGGINQVKDANFFYKLMKGDKDKGVIGYHDIINDVVKKTEDGSIYKWVTRNLGEGNKRLVQVFNLLPDTMQNDIRATIIKQSSKAPDGNFSFNYFLKNMADQGETRMTKEAKDFLFKGNRQAYKHLKDIEKASEYFKSLAGYMNHSNTETHRVWHEITKPLFSSMAVGAGVGMADGGLGAGLKSAIVGGGIGMGIAGGKILSARQTAKLMTNPEFLKWVADGAKLAIKQPGSVSTQFLKLPIIATANPEIKEEMQVYMNALSLPYKVIHKKNGSVIQGIK